MGGDAFGGLEFQRGCVESSRLRGYGQALRHGLIGRESIQLRRARHVLNPKTLLAEIV